jgi:glycosyltransferase involved in cell wall biosynthesis
VRQTVSGARGNPCLHAISTPDAPPRPERRPSHVVRPRGVISCRELLAIVPAYNEAGAIGSTVSELHVHAPDFDVLVVDDGSTDDSAAVAEAFGPPVRVIRQMNQGESAARNHGIDAARGDWVAFIDADDLWTPDKLAKQIAALGEHPEAVAVHTNVYFFGESQERMDLTLTPPDERYSLEAIAQGSLLHISSLLVRKDVSPRFPEWTRYAEDLIYQLELVQRGQAVLVPEYLTGYRKHSASQSSRSAVDIHWHQTVLHWLGAEAVNVETAVKRRIADAWLARMVGLAWQARERRNWDVFWELRRYLEGFRGDPRVDELLANRIYPRSLYRLLDWIRGGAAR